MDNQLMIMCGAKITAHDDKLSKVLVSYIANKIRNPKPEIEAQIRLMREMMAIDEKKYREFKKQLPYIVTATLNPPIRRSENFAHLEVFILDLDHLQEKNINISELKSIINIDTRVMMSFVSPSGDGLKIMFRLKEKIYDAGIYKVFYKEFAVKFAAQYNIEQVVDAKTCDVTRACFISIDPEVYYNPDAELIDYKKFINIDNPTELLDITKGQDKETKQSLKTESTKNPDPDQDVINKIKQTLGEKVKQPPTPKNPPQVAEELNQIIPNLTEYLNKNGIEIFNIRNIQCGKQITLKLGQKTSVINIFYGNKSKYFTVVRVDKRETDGDFNELMRQLILQFVYQLEF